MRVMFIGPVEHLIVNKKIIVSVRSFQLVFIVFLYMQCFTGPVGHVIVNRKIIVTQN